MQKNQKFLYIASAIATVDICLAAVAVGSMFHKDTIPAYARMDVIESYTSEEREKYLRERWMSDETGKEIDKTVNEVMKKHSSKVEVMAVDMEEDKKITESKENISASPYPSQIYQIQPQTSLSQAQTPNYEQVYAQNETEQETALNEPLEAQEENIAEAQEEDIWSGYEESWEESQTDSYTEQPYVEESSAPVESSYSGPILNSSVGTVIGPSGKETYYNLPMGGVVNIMRGIGNTDEYWVREDGAKMLGDYVMVAANLDIHPRGSLVETSLGTGIVADTGTFAYSNPYQIDIATAW